MSFIYDVAHPEKSAAVDNINNKECSSEVGKMGKKQPRGQRPDPLSGADGFGE